MEVVDNFCSLLKRFSYIDITDPNRPGLTKFLENNYNFTEEESKNVGFLLGKLLCVLYKNKYNDLDKESRQLIIKYLQEITKINYNEFIQLESNFSFLSDYVNCIDFGESFLVNIILYNKTDVESRISNVINFYNENNSFIDKDCLDYIIKILLKNIRKMRDFDSYIEDLVKNNDINTIDFLTKYKYFPEQNIYLQCTDPQNASREIVEKTPIKEISENIDTNKFEKTLIDINTKKHFISDAEYLKKIEIEENIGLNEKFFYVDKYKDERMDFFKNKFILKYIKEKFNLNNIEIPTEESLFSFKGISSRFRNSWSELSKMTNDIILENLKKINLIDENNTLNLNEFLKFIDNEDNTLATNDKNTMYIRNYAIIEYFIRSRYINTENFFFINREKIISDRDSDEYKLYKKLFTYGFVDNIYIFSSTKKIINGSRLANMDIVGKKIDFEDEPFDYFDANIISDTEGEVKNIEEKPTKVHKLNREENELNDGSEHDQSSVEEIFNDTEIIDDDVEGEVKNIEEKPIKVHKLNREENKLNDGNEYDQLIIEMVDSINDETKNTEEKLVEVKELSGEESKLGNYKTQHDTNQVASLCDIKTSGDTKKIVANVNNDNNYDNKGNRYADKDDKVDDNVKDSSHEEFETDKVIGIKNGYLKDTFTVKGGYSVDKNVIEYSKQFIDVDDIEKIKINIDINVISKGVLPEEKQDMIKEEIAKKIMQIAVLLKEEQEYEMKNSQFLLSETRKSIKRGIKTGEWKARYFDQSNNGLSI